MTLTIKHKIGATFDKLVEVSDEQDQPVDLSAWSVDCHIRKSGGLDLVQALTIETHALGFRMRATAAQTAAWPHGASLKADIRAVAPGGATEYTETFTISTVQSMTHD